MVTRGGMYVFQLFDYYGASGMCLLWMAFWECIAVGWVYGANRFAKNIEEMIGFKPSRLFIICWKYLTPALTASIFIISAIILEPIKYNSVYVYPKWAIMFGWFLALISMIAVPFYVIYLYFTTSGKNFSEVIILSIFNILATKHDKLA